MQTFAYRLPLYCYLYYDVCLIARPPTGPSFAEKEISQLEETGPLPETVQCTHEASEGSFLKELSGTVGIQTGNTVMDSRNSKTKKSLSRRGKTEIREKTLCQGEE